VTTSSLLHRFGDITIFRSSPGDLLIDVLNRRTELGCVRPYVLPSVHEKFFSDLDLIWCVGRP